MFQIQDVTQQTKGTAPKSQEKLLSEGICPDILTMHLFNSRFTQELMEELDSLDHNIWHKNNNAGQQLIHLYEIGLELDWITMLQFYYEPRQCEVITGIKEK